MTSSTFIWINGEFRSADAACISPLDQGLRHGIGVFDTMLISDGEPVMGIEHLERLRRHAAAIDIAPRTPPATLLNAIAELIKRGGLNAGRYAVNTYITAGPGERGLHRSSNPEPNEIIVANAAPLPETFSPLRLATARTCRNDTSIHSRIKSLNYGDNEAALREALAKGADEALMLNTKGHVACASIGNLFIVENGRLFTPPREDGAVDGMIRRRLIALHGAVEKTLLPRDLASADAVFMTNAIRGIVPIVEIDGTATKTGLDIANDYPVI